MSIEEAIKKYEQVFPVGKCEHIAAEILDARHANVCKACLMEKLMLLESKPEPTEFTKKCRELRKRGATHEQWEYATLLMEACDSIDRLSAENDKLKKH